MPSGSESDTTKKTNSSTTLESSDTFHLYSKEGESLHNDFWIQSLSMQANVISLQVAVTVQHNALVSKKQCAAVLY